jgi:hypothetical protein
MNRVERKSIALIDTKGANMNDQRISKFTAYFVLATIAVSILALLSGCTVSVGAEGRAFYPRNDLRQGYYDAGGMDGMFTTPAPAPKGFKTLNIGGE